jgi:large subunit ribosomal protein L17
MRHRKAGRKLKRTASHRRATLAALSTSLLRHKRITTTVAKAKETRMVVEKMITRAKNASAASDAPARGVHARREVGKLIKDRSAIKELFGPIAGKAAGRPGGYTRIVKLGRRQGDGAELAVIELVDFNTGQEETEKPAAAKKEKKTRAPRKAAKAKGGSTEATPAQSADKESESQSHEQESR